MIAFILIAATLGPVVGAHSLQELEKKRSAFLAFINKEYPTDFLGGLSLEINRAIYGIEGETDQESWLSFITNSDAVHPFLKKTGVEGISLQAALEKASQEMVEVTLPAVGSEKFLEGKEFMCDGNGYQTMIPYLFSDFELVIRGYVAAKFAAEIQKHFAGQLSQSQNLDFTQITEPFTTLLTERLDAYVDACEKPAAGPQPGQSEANWKKNEAIRVSNLKVELLNLVSSKSSFVVKRFLDNDYKKMVVARNFLTNAYVNISHEIEYLAALAVTAPEKLAEVTPRIKLWAKALIRLASAGIKVFQGQGQYSELDVKALATPWAYAYSNAAGDNPEIAAEVFGILMKYLSTNGNSDIAFAMAQDAYAYLISGGRSFNQKSAAKANLEARPFTDDSTNQATDALRAWDHISEAPKGDHSAIEWFKNIAPRYNSILAVPKKQIAALNYARALFTCSLVPASETQLYAALYEALTNFIVSGASLDEAAFAKNLNEFLDQHYSANRFFILMKLLVANHLPHGNYPIAFPGATNELLTNTADLLQQPAYENLSTTVSKAHKAMGLKAFIKSTPKPILQRLEEVIAGIQEQASHQQDFLSDNFRILNVVTSSQKII